MWARISLHLTLLGLWVGLPVFTSAAEETDQFLTWRIELTDSAPVLNGYMEDKIRGALEEANGNGEDPCDCEEITTDIFARIYIDRFRANLMEFIEDNETIDVFPARDLSQSELMELSIYRDATLPYIIRVIRSIRIGEVYLGIDKLAHFFGFGMRYYDRYLQDLRDGLTEEEAVTNAVNWGIFTENTFLGKGITGIFSFGDLEGNYQGLRLAMDFCEGSDPYLRNNGEGWVLSHPVDLREYVTPAFDESFYPPWYAPEILETVLPLLTELYSDQAESPRVLDRFSRYTGSSASRSMKVVETYFREQGIASQREAIAEALRPVGAHPVAPRDPHSNDRVGRESPSE